MLTVTFALLVVRHPLDKSLFVLVDEGKRGWWLPGGGVDGHETFDQGARREAMEEARVEVEENDGLSLLKIELSYQRLRYILTGEAKSSSISLKPHADKESDGARWMSLKDTQELDQGSFPVPNSRLRGSEPLEWFAHVEQGGPQYPLCHGLIEHLVEPGTTGIAREGRDVFFARVSCVIALLCTTTNEFVVDGSGVRLPCFEPDLLRGETLQACMERGLDTMGFALVDSSNVQIVAIRDVRNVKNELDFRVSFLIKTPKTRLKTATKGMIVEDSFDARTVERVVSNVPLASLDVLGTE